MNFPYTSIFLSVSHWCSSISALAVIFNDIIIINVNRLLVLASILITILLYYLHSAPKCARCIRYTNRTWFLGFSEWLVSMSRICFAEEVLLWRAGQTIWWKFFCWAMPLHGNIGFSNFARKVSLEREILYSLGHGRPRYRSIAWFSANTYFSSQINQGLEPRSPTSLSSALSTRL